MRSESRGVALSLDVRKRWKKDVRNDIMGLPLGNSEPYAEGGEDVFYTVDDGRLVTPCEQESHDVTSVVEDCRAAVTAGAHRSGHHLVGKARDCTLTVLHVHRHVYL